MQYIENFLNYLKVLKKDSIYTLKSYRNDLLELYDFHTDLIHINSTIVSEYLEYLYSKGLNRKFYFSKA